MPPDGVTNPGDVLNNPQEGLIRRGRRAKKPPYVLDQITQKMRPPAAIFEPRRPETRPNATVFDKYLSVNILSSLTAANLPRDWRGNNSDFYSVQLFVESCHALSFTVTWEPIEDNNPARDNPHHGGIQGVVQLLDSDRDAYDIAITKLAKASEVLPECLP